MEVIPGSTNEDEAKSGVKLEDVVKISPRKKIEPEVIKEKVNEYYFEFNVTLNNKKVMLISYIIQDKNKQSAEGIARNKLKNKYSNIKTIKLKTSRKKCFKDVEEDKLIKILPDDYEVKFRININGIKYDKCFIISSSDESNINSLLEKRCKKEFKNYRSLTSINYKLADDNSKEYSKEVEEEIITNKTEVVDKPQSKGIKIKKIELPDINPITDDISLSGKLKLASMSKKSLKKIKNTIESLMDQNVEVKLRGENAEIVKDALNATKIVSVLRNFNQDEVYNTLKIEDYLLKYNNENELIGIEPQISMLNMDYYKYSEYIISYVYKDHTISKPLTIVSKDIRDIPVSVLFIPKDKQPEKLTLEYLDNNSLVCVILHKPTGKLTVYGMSFLLRAVKLSKKL